MGYPHVVLAERVRASDGRLWCEKIRVLDHLCDAFRLFFRRKASHCRVQIPLFRQQFGPEPYGVHRVLSQRVQCFERRFGSHGVDHALEGFPTPHHADLKQLRIFSFEPLPQEGSFCVVEQHVSNTKLVYIYPHVVHKRCRISSATCSLRRTRSLSKRTKRSCLRDARPRISS